MPEDQTAITAVQTASPQTSENLWTVADVARFFRCTQRHVINLQANGLPHFYLGRLVRFDPTEVRAYLQQNRRIAVTKARRAALETARQELAQSRR